MALLPLYRCLKLPSRWAVFPTDFVQIGVAAVPDDQLDHLLAIPVNCWSLQSHHTRRSVYASARISGLDGHPIRFLHRIVFERCVGPIPDGLEVDHINGDGLNCMPSNLRLALHRQNRSNSEKPRHYAGNRQFSSYKGVCRNTRGGNPWRSYVKSKGIHVDIGYFSSEKEAAFAYDLASRLLHGEFALGNNIDGSELTPDCRTAIESVVLGRLRSRELIPAL